MVENTTFDGAEFFNFSFRANSKDVIPPMSFNCFNGNMMLKKKVKM